MARSLEDVAAILRAELAGQYAAGMPLLRRSPSTGAIRFLDYWDTLDAAAREDLLGAFAHGCAFKFVPGAIARNVAADHFSSPAGRDFHHAMVQSPRYSFGFRYFDLRMRKAVMNDAQSMTELEKNRATLDWQPRDDLRPDLVPDPENIVVLKAADMRKPLDAMLRALFAVSKKKSPGGELEYEGTLDGRGISVFLDFAARGVQLRTGVTVNAADGTVVRRIAFEDLWSCGYPGWNYLTEENFARSLDLLREHIVYLAGLVDRIAPLVP